VVAAPRHPARPDRAGVAAAERPARAHAPHAQGGGDAPPTASPGRAAARFDASAASTTRSGRTRRSARRTPASRYAPSPGPTPRACRRSSTPRTGRCGA
jgi:hypothetical protein